MNKAQQYILLIIFYAFLGWLYVMFPIFNEAGTMFCLGFFSFGIFASLGLLIINLFGGKK